MFTLPRSRQDSNGKFPRCLFPTPSCWVVPLHLNHPLKPAVMIGRRWIQILFAFVLISASGCRRIECGQYQRLLEDNAKREQLLNWADREIFSRNFSEYDFRVSGMMGPNRYGGNFSIDRANISMPSWLAGYNIRAVGPNKLHPDVLLIGKRRYQGVVVTRGSLDDSLKGTTITLASLDDWEGRLGVMCY